MPKKILPEEAITELDRATGYSGNIEAHIIADMLRIESITTELREFKTDTKKRFDKIEGWLVSIVAITFTSLIGTVGTLIYRMIV